MVQRYGNMPTHLIRQAEHAIKDKVRSAIALYRNAPAEAQSPTSEETTHEDTRSRRAGKGQTT